MFPIWFLMALAATMFVAYVTFRNGLWAVLAPDSGWMLLSLFTSLVVLVTLWRSRPRRKKPPEPIRLNLE
jgi:membrane protein implicated in regulation of membrane protease activity